MIAFWIAAAVLSAAAAMLMLARGARAAAGPAEDPALAVHRRQLSEIDELAERGLIPEDERKAARAEAGRRLLSAAEHQEIQQGSGGRRVALAVAAATPIVALGLYLLVGHPGYPDQPFAKRVGEWRHTDPSRLDPPRMAAVLTQIAAERPRDPEPLKNLALAYMASNDMSHAIEALRKALALSPDRADLWSQLGEAFVMQADGEVDEDARAAFAEAVRLDPRSQGARYFLGRADIQDGRVAEGLAAWKALAGELPAGDPRGQALSAEIASVERSGGLKPVESEQPADMQATIRGMVDGLAARLAANPDDPDGWVRLVRAYTVLGEGEKRDAALAKARVLYKDKPEILKALDQAVEVPK
jgi:cytochrome c-type biogenesis protein CcmH